MPRPKLTVADYIQRISNYGKENLADILHNIGEAVPMLTRQSRCRLYLEDLTTEVEITDVRVWNKNPRAPLIEDTALSAAEDF